jgi:hypothetical protein
MEIDVGGGMSMPSINNMVDTFAPIAWGNGIYDGGTSASNGTVCHRKSAYKMPKPAAKGHFQIYYFRRTQSSS